MPLFGPISQRGLVRALRRFGFEGPVPGTRHAFMTKGTVKLRIPNPHRGDIGRDLLARIAIVLAVAGSKGRQTGYRDTQPTLCPGSLAAKAALFVARREVLQDVQPVRIVA